MAVKPILILNKVLYCTLHTQTFRPKSSVQFEQNGADVHEMKLDIRNRETQLETMREGEKDGFSMSLLRQDLFNTNGTINNRHRDQCSTHPANYKPHIDQHTAAE